MLNITNYDTILLNEIDGWMITDIVDVDAGSVKDYYRFEFRKDNNEIVMCLHKKGVLSKSDGKSLLYTLTGYCKNGTKTKTLQISKDSVQSRMEFAFDAMLFKLLHES